jgi:hypothetical protein
MESYVNDVRRNDGVSMVVEEGETIGISVNVRSCDVDFQVVTLIFK